MDAGHLYFREALAQSAASVGAGLTAEQLTLMAGDLWAAAIVIRVEGRVPEVDGFSMRTEG